MRFAIVLKQRDSEGEGGSTGRKYKINWQGPVVGFHILIHYSNIIALQLSYFIQQQSYFIRQATAKLCETKTLRQLQQYTLFLVLIIIGKEVLQNGIQRGIFITF